MAPQAARAPTKASPILPRPAQSIAFRGWTSRQLSEGGVMHRCDLKPAKPFLILHPISSATDS